MVASRAPFSRPFDGASSPSQSTMSRSLQSSSPSIGITSNLISNLAVMALKRRLAGQAHVGCDVTASASDILLKGQVGPVTVNGRGWKSRLGLSCRAISATVDKCNLDMGKVVSNQKLVLITAGKIRIDSLVDVSRVPMSMATSFYLFLLMYLQLREMLWSL